MAIYQRRRDDIDTRGLMHHSDRGVQYRDVRYGQALARYQAVASVGSTGDSYDNTLAEDLNSLYKAELNDNEARPGYAGPWRDRRGQTQNRRLGPLVQHPPPHLALGGITPQQVENQHTTTRKEAASTSLHKTQDLTTLESSRPPHLTAPQHCPRSSRAKARRPSQGRRAWSARGTHVTPQRAHLPQRTHSPPRAHPLHWIVTDTSCACPLRAIVMLTVSPAR